MCTNGPTAEGLKAAGQKTNYTVEECTLGPTAEAMMANIMKTRSMALEFMFGLIKRSMKVTGRMESNMAKASSPTLKVNQESDCGRMAIE